MKIRLRLTLIMACASLVAPALLMAPLAHAPLAHARPANVKIHTPKPGTQERAAIMNALRVPVTKYHKGKRVTFTQVDEFRVGGGWAHLGCVPVDDKGRQLGDRELPYLTALLHLEKGQWRVKEYVYAGDVVEISWAKKYASVPLNVLGIKASDR